MNKGNTTKRVLLWGGIAALIVLSIWGVSRFADTQGDIPFGEVMPVSAADRTKGNPDADVVLIEYSDFECPACRAYWPLLLELADRFEDEMLFVYRHFPLTQIHAQAELAARASEAAGQQGMFWEMHDRIFEGQTTWAGSRNARDIFLGYAQELALDIEQFEEDLDSRAVRDKVSRDSESGARVNVPGTPTFFLNGERIQNPQSLDAFIQLIEAHIDETAASQTEETMEQQVAKEGDTVLVHYVGTLEDGTMFDSSRERGQPFSFTIGAGQVIPGWEQGIPGMQVGETKELVIPPELAYGAGGVPGTIPPHATLYFEVELIAIR